jgi:hypothetical protein
MVPHQRLLRRAGWLLAACLLLPAYASADPRPREWNPNIVAHDFVSVVDNPYFPLPAGRTLVYRGQTKDGLETMEFEITGRTKNVMGVNTTVVIERSTVNGQLVEVSENWFAQDNQGTVWYFGEATQEYVNGVPGSTAGSWEAGVAGARPGIIMEADPQPGDSYFQEFAEGVAQDMAQVMNGFKSATVPAGSYSNVLETKEWSPIEPSSVEHKSYAPGVGLILEEKGASERLELVEVRG